MVMMFHSARIKLTAWYLVIIMFVSVCFSAFVYRGVMAEVSRGLRARALRTPFYTQTYISEDEAIYEEIKRQVLFQLGLVNLGILVGSSLAGYFLAGRTLKPIEEMVEEQKRFVGDASHELRTPLTSLKTEIEVALRNKLSIKDAKELLKSNLEEVDKMQALTSYLLSLTRYEQKDIKLVKELVYLNEVATKTVQNLQKVADKKNIKIKEEIANARTIGNVGSLIELATILLDNAIKYSSVGGKIIVRTYKKDKKAILQVQDFGVGIKASDIPYIFNRFYRADGSRNKERVDGYGLGLSIAQSIANLHGGKIEVESEIGKGSTFSVILPS